MRLVGGCSHVRRDPPGNLLASVFSYVRNVDSPLALPMIIWLCTALDCFVVGVKSLFLGDDGLELSYLVFGDDVLRLGRVFKSSLRLWMNSMGCGSGSMNIQNLYAIVVSTPYNKEHCQGHLLTQYGEIMKGSWLMTWHLRHLQGQFQLFFDCMTIVTTGCWKIQYWKSSHGDDFLTIIRHVTGICIQEWLLTSACRC